MYRTLAGLYNNRNGHCKEDIRKRQALCRVAGVGLDTIWNGNDVRMETKVRLMKALRKADIKK